MLYHRIFRGKNNSGIFVEVELIQDYYLGTSEKGSEPARFCQGMC